MRSLTKFCVTFVLEKIIVSRRARFFDFVYNKKQTIKYRHFFNFLTFNTFKHLKYFKLNYIYFYFYFYYLRIFMIKDFIKIWLKKQNI